MSDATTIPSVIVNDGTSWTTDGPLAAVIDSFNGGNPLNIVNSVKTMISDGFTIAGTASFLGNAEVTASATVLSNGDVTLRAELAEVQLSHLLGAAPRLGLVRGFEVPMPATSVLVQRSGGALSLSAATKIANVGELVFVAQHGQAQLDQAWNVAVGFRLDVATIAALPGLHGSRLAAFDDFIGLTDLMMVISSRDDTAFDFPELAQFQAPALGSGRLSLPPQAAGKLVEGLNIYASLSTTKGRGFQAIAKFLKLQLNGSIGVTLAVSLPDPETRTKLFLTVAEQIKPGVTLSGELGVLLTAGQGGVFLTGDVTAPVQGQPTQFDVAALVVENGVLFSGSMINTAPIHFDIDHVRFKLANVGLVIGIDDEGIPSLGFCATIDVDRINAALAVFIDSTNPSNSMFAAAVSDLTLLDVAEVLAKQTRLPEPLYTVLGAFGLKSLTAFALPIDIAHALDHRDLGRIAAAFAQHGVTIPSASDQVLLDANTPGKLWYLTDLAVMNHYTLRQANGVVSVALEAQLYAAPQATAIGATSFPQGYKIIGEIDLLLARAAIDVEIAGGTGICAEMYVEPIIVINRNFLAITGAAGVGGPYVSLATYARPQALKPEFRDPHFAMSGDIRLLGAEIASVFMTFSKAGLVFDMKAVVNPVVQIDLHAEVQGLQTLAFSGAIQIGIDHDFDLGPLGRVQIRADAHGSLNMGVHAGAAFATFQAGLTFQSWQISAPRLTLDVNTGSLPHAAEQLVAELAQVLKTGLLADVQRFLDWTRRGVLVGLQGTEQVAAVLKNDFNLAADESAKLLYGVGYEAKDIAAALKTVFNQGADDVARIFKTALGLHADVVSTILQAAGLAVHETETVVTTTYDWAKSHLNPSHW